MSIAAWLDSLKPGLSKYAKAFEVCAWTWTHRRAAALTMCFCSRVTQKLGADNESDLVDIACDAEMRTLLVDRCDKLGRVTRSRMS